MSVSEESSDNVYLPWSVEDDRLLYDLYRKKTDINIMMKALGRGRKGIEVRCNHLIDPNHKAFLRLFGGKLDENLRISLRPCKDVITRLLYDPTLSICDFSMVSSIV